MEIQRTRIAKDFGGQKNKDEGLTLLVLKICCEATVLQTVWHWYKNRQIEQRNRMESRNRLTSIELVYFQQSCHGNSMGEKIIFSVKDSGIIRHSYK